MPGGEDRDADRERSIWVTGSCPPYTQPVHRLVSLWLDRFPFHPGLRAPNAPEACLSGSFCVLFLPTADDKVKLKVEYKKHHISNMTNEVMGNYLRTQRHRRGLSQREIGSLVGCQHGQTVGKHERSKSAPSLLVALAYEVVFEVPVGQLFTGFRSVVAQAVASNLEDLRAQLEAKKEKLSPEKLQWLMERRNGG